jgi:hypothetical protein
MLFSKAVGFVSSGGNSFYTQMSLLSCPRAWQLYRIERPATTATVLRVTIKETPSILRNNLEGLALVVDF